MVIATISYVKTARIVSDLSRRLEVNVLLTSEGFKFDIQAGRNEVGILFRVCAVLFAYRYNIIRARIHTSEDQHISDEFLLSRDSDLDESRVREMVEDLEKLLFDGLSVLEYLTEKEADPGTTEPLGGTVEIQFEDSDPIIEVRAADKAGLLLSLAQAFYLTDVDILEASIESSSDGQVCNRFRVNSADRRFQSPEFCRRLTEELQLLL